jgi:hypothetical protein
MAADAYRLRTELLGPLPVINHFLARMGLGASLERFVPHNDARLRLAPAAVLGVVVRNLVTHRQPVYAMGEWAAPYDPRRLGLASDDVGALNDDRSVAPWSGSSRPIERACSPRSWWAWSASSGSTPASFTMTPRRSPSPGSTTPGEGRSGAARRCRP